MYTESLRVLSIVQSISNKGLFNFQKKRGARKERPSEGETWQLARFYPIIEVPLFDSFVAYLVYMGEWSGYC